jgi:molybdopterin-guanine dinucleotide biosynthesis protein A
MGRDKALIPLGGQPLIAHLLARVEGLGDELLITTNRPEPYARFGARTASDPVPGAGALEGLHTALTAAKGDLVLLLACDMPFVSRSLLEHMLGLADDADIVVPRREGRFEPLHALYKRGRCLPPLRSALASGERRMISFFPQVHVLTIEEPELTRLDPQGRSFFNVNTPEDLAQAESMLADSQ